MTYREYKVFGQERSELPMIFKSDAQSYVEMIKVSLDNKPCISIFIRPRINKGQELT